MNKIPNSDSNLNSNPRPSFGIILLDKRGDSLSSNTAMQRIRKGLKIKKMGHTGTLDPLATGMLPLCFGKATQLCSYFLDGSKTYQTRIALGQQRSTGDLEGEVINTQPIPELDKNKLDKILLNFLGKQSQIPPMYSALKKDGKALYQLAREGIEIEREPREIEIYQIDLKEFGSDYLDLMISCSKGTYIRTLGEDISKALGTVGHLSSLRRIACGPWREEQMHTEEQILANPEKYILTLEQALDWPVIEISKQEFDFLLQGKSPKISIPKDISGHLFLKSEGNIIGFGEAQQGKLCWRKFLVTD